MSMISDQDYVLQAIRLSALRHTDDATTARIISLDPAVALNPYIAASGLADIDRWPEITRAIDSPEPDFGYSSAEDGRPRARGLRYTQTIMGSKSGAAGMRVTGRRTTEGGRTGRRDRNRLLNRSPEQTPLAKPPDDGFFSRPRAGSAPQPLLEPPSAIGSVIASGRGMGTILQHAGVLEQASSFSEMATEDGSEMAEQTGYEESSTGVGESARPSDLENTVDEPNPLLGGAVVDEGSDVGENEEEEDAFHDFPPEKRRSLLASRRSSATHEYDALDFVPISVLSTTPRPSALTLALNKHIPHLVSTSSAAAASTPPPATVNPFASLYASVAAPSHIPSLAIEFYYPHSDEPRKPLAAKVRKDATVEEVTGHGLYMYWSDGRQPALDADDDEMKLTTIPWGLRIVEDDGEVDEDFPALDRDGQISRFAYGEFAIVQATDMQARQNAAKAPNIIRRPSRVIAVPKAQKPRPDMQPTVSSTSLNSSDMVHDTAPGQDPFTSPLGRSVLLRIRVSAGADVRFTTTISVSHDMYFADLTDVLVRKKRLPLPSAEWVLCLADFSLALPLDRTVASLQGKTDLALVKRQWAVEHGLRIGDRRGGDPSASIFKRFSEPAATSKFGPGLADLSQTYKKYTVMRKMPIGRHERVLAIDGDYVHVMPSESRTFFDSTKTTSFHISLVVSCKLTGRAGGFKINVWRETGQKRYEFDAENGKQAAEIIASIRALMKLYQAESARPS